MTTWKSVVSVVCQIMGAWWGILKGSSASVRHPLAIFGWPALGALFAFSISIMVLLVLGVAMLAI